MPYSRNADLPKSVRDHLSLGAQTSYRKAYNSSWKQYDDAARRRRSASRGETAHRVALAAVKRSRTPSGAAAGLGRAERPNQEPVVPRANSSLSANSRIPPFITEAQRPVAHIGGIFSNFGTAGSR